MTNKKRQSKSWKTEAQKLEAMLVQACDYIFEEGGGPMHGTGLSEWREAFKDRRDAEGERVRKSAIGKLTAAERKALGIDDGGAK